MPKGSLKRLSLGQSFAEYDKLLDRDNVYVETPGLRAALDDAQGKRFFVGRRGTGKTAIALYLQKKVPGNEVPTTIAQDYKEACLVLADSPKASAALSRRCLQLLLRSAGGANHGDLYGEIQQVLDAKALPTALAESIDAVRVVGNFAAHPIKSKSTGEVVPVEPHEAEWNLDVLESLFDFYFVMPARIKAKRAALNAKSADAGKPPLK